MRIASVNPATGETLRTFPELSDAELEARVSAASEAFPRWRRTPVRDRARVVTRAAEILDAEKESFGALMTLEMGKLRSAAAEEAAKCAVGCRYYAEHAEEFLAPEPLRGEGLTGQNFVAFQPLGVILAVMPWNFPFWQVIRFAAPAMVAGNVGLLKHASNVPQCALALEDLFRRAGAPEGVFQTLLIGATRVEQLIGDLRIAAATLTGSERAGREVGAAAGRHIKKTVLELGGSDPFVVMPSADLAKAVETAVRARMINNGQSCIAAKRFIVAEPIAEEFEHRFATAVAALGVGDPTDPATELGPLASRQLRDDLHAQVTRSIAAGARLLTGGRPLPGAGAFYAPTVLANVPRESPAAREELFGPVAAVLRARDLDEAIALANDSRFGLGASAWTSDPVEVRRFAEELEAGSVFINGMVVSDPRFPFGGVKQSGYGRELGVHGMREFQNVKTVRIDVRASGSATE
jgi:succinate-semialdehyde dehydrogenase/glutarate-semialdehyde dehydrogenase